MWRGHLSHNQVSLEILTPISFPRKPWNLILEVESEQKYHKREKKKKIKMLFISVSSNVQIYNYISTIIY